MFESCRVRQCSNFPRSQAPTPGWHDRSVRQDSGRAKTARKHARRYPRRWRAPVEATMRLLPLLNGFVGKRSEEHTSELQSLMRISYAVFCLKIKHKRETNNIL